MLSYAEVVSKSEELQALAAEMDEMRPARIQRIVHTLIENGRLDREAIRGREETVRKLGEVVGRFWLPYAVLSGQSDDLPAAAEEHARLALFLWEPYATERGRAEIAELLA